MLIHNGRTHWKEKLSPTNLGSPSHCELKAYFETFRFERAITLKRKPKRKCTTNNGKKTINIGTEPLSNDKTSKTRQNQQGNVT